MLHALSPLDGRYAKETATLRQYFSEFALMRERLNVEIQYLIALSCEEGVPEVPLISQKDQGTLQDFLHRFSEEEAQEVKRIEEKTRHDVKAIEQYMRIFLLSGNGLQKLAPFVHFALTSEDVNNIAYGVLIHRCLKEKTIPDMEKIIGAWKNCARRWHAIDLLSLTHGQPATSTTLGKEIMVFVERVERQCAIVRRLRMHGKFGGAVGNFAAHRAAYPAVNWPRFGKEFVASFGLIHLRHTTQINPHDDIAELSHCMVRINTILLDYARDMWLYISRGVFRQQAVKGEVGSSAMPHKVNPIDVENAEGNLGISTALFSHFAEKLPVSRLQRDLSDSTVLRNLGVAFGHHDLAVESIMRGLGRMEVDREVCARELKEHPEVLAELVQTILRKNGVEDGYERVKAIVRGKKVTQEAMRTFIEQSSMKIVEKKKLLANLGQG